jgi:hypothetical protein
MITSEQEEALRKAVDDYHYALDTRQHGGMVAEQFVAAVKNILDMPWVRGAVLDKRKGGVTS